MWTLHGIDEEHSANEGGFCACVHSVLAWLWCHTRPSFCTQACTYIQQATPLDTMVHNKNMCLNVLCNSSFVALYMCLWSSTTCHSCAKVKCILQCQASTEANTFWCMYIKQSTCRDSLEIHISILRHKILIPGHLISTAAYSSHLW